MPGLSPPPKAARRAPWPLPARWGDRPGSIEWRLLGGATILFAGFGFVLFLAIRQNALAAAEEAFDRVLGAAALSIADTVEFENGAVTVDIPYSAFAILGTSRLNRVFYRVVAPDGAIVTGSPVLGLEIPHASGPELRLANSALQNEPVRIAAVGRFRSDANSGQAGWIDVMVGETHEARIELARQLMLNAIAPLVILAVLAFGMIWFSIRKAFAPLRALESSLRRRDRTDLSPISAHVPKEISTLVQTLNLFMGRLESTLEGLRRVTADAAHQLRTPLTALRMQAEVALDEPNPDTLRHRVTRIHANAVNASVLANKLLADATLLHNLRARQSEIVDLGTSLSDVIARLRVEGRFADRLEELQIDAPAAPILIDAEPTSLGEMLRNIIENALIHGAGATRIVLRRDTGNALLTVADRGPGIPAHLRAAVFDRFTRGTDAVPGSGLGLAIARDVVEALDGRITLSTPAQGGVQVDISLPLAAPAPDAASGSPVPPPASPRPRRTGQEAAP